MSRYLSISTPAVILLAMVVATATPASAQFDQTPGQGGDGQTGGGGGRGGRGGENGGGGGGGGDAGNGGTSGRTGGDTGGMRSADRIFSDGIEREGAPEERGIGNAPDATEAGGGLGGRRGAGGFGGLGGFGGMGGFGGGFSPFGGGFGGQGQQNERTIRTRITSGVDVAPPAPRAVGAIVNRRLASLAGDQRFVGVNVAMDGRTAILTGRVASEADRRMARLLVRLEPGVSRIENRLEVGRQPEL